MLKMDPNSLPLFPQLPEDVRILIWEATLPDARVFQVQTVHHIERKTARTLRFHIQHAPPIALSVCEESRRVAQRCGFFIGARSITRRDGGLWFNPLYDILYVDRHNRSLFKMNGVSEGPIQGVEKVQHFGVEWRAIMVTSHVVSATGDMRAVWRPMFRNLRPHMPRLKAVHYMLPVVRVRGCHNWAREPHKSHTYDAKLEELPQRARIPWSDMLSTSALALTHPVSPPDAGPGIKPHTAKTRSGFLGYFMRWEDVRTGLEMAMREACREAEERGQWAQDRKLELELAEYGERRDWKEKKICVEELQVVGWRLRRVGAVYGDEAGDFVGLDGRDEDDV